MRRQRTALTADSACASDIALRRTRSHRGCTAFWVVGIVVWWSRPRGCFSTVCMDGQAKTEREGCSCSLFSKNICFESQPFVILMKSIILWDLFFRFWSRRSVFACMGFCEGHKGTGLLSTSDVSAAQRERMSYCTAEAVGGILAFYVFGLACATFLAQIQACELDLGGIDS